MVYCVYKDYHVLFHLIFVEHHPHQIERLQKYHWHIELRHQVG